MTRRAACLTRPPLHAALLPLAVRTGGRGAALRLRSAVLGGALGGCIGVPAGLMQDKLAALLPEEHRRARAQRAQQTEDIIAGQGGSARGEEGTSFRFRFRFCCWLPQRRRRGNQWSPTRCLPPSPLPLPLLPPCPPAPLAAAAVQPERAGPELRGYDVTTAVIAQLEASLATSPMRRQQTPPPLPAEEGPGGGGGRSWWKVWGK